MSDSGRYAIDTMQSVCLKEAGVNAEAPMAEETTLMQLIFGGYLRSKVFQWSSGVNFDHIGFLLLSYYALRFMIYVFGFCF